MITIQEAIILAFAAVLILVLFLFFGKLQSVFLSKPDETGSIGSFRSLSAKIEELLESPDDNDYRLFNYFIAKDKVLVKFDTGEDFNYPHMNVIASSLEISYGANDRFYKPFKGCGNSACLCLYGGVPPEAHERDKNVVECTRDGMSDKNIIFTFSPIFHIGGGYNYDQRLNLLYIEKNFDGRNGIYNIYISPIDTNDNNDPANIRKKVIDASR